MGGVEGLGLGARRGERGVFSFESDLAENCFVVLMKEEEEEEEEEA